MSLTGGMVLFATLWFIVLFVLLPIGQRSQADAGEIVPGTHEGAPHDLRFGRKALWATVWTVGLFLLILAVIRSGWITRDDILNFAPHMGQ